MAANIVLVHDDFPGSHNNSPAGCRYDAALFKDTMAAIDALKATHQIEILITRVLQFRLGRLRRCAGAYFVGEAPLAAISYFLLPSSECAALPGLEPTRPHRCWPNKPHTLGMKTSGHSTRDAAGRLPRAAGRLAS
jgi:hypothetical protein